MAQTFESLTYETRDRKAYLTLDGPSGSTPSKPSEDG